MAKSDKVNIFIRILDFILGRGRGDPERHNLRNVNRQLAKSGYKYYSFARDEVKPQFASLIWSIYKIVAPLRVFFLENNNMDLYKRLVVVYMMDENQRKFYDSIIPENINIAAQSRDFADVVRESKENYAKLQASFKGPQVEEINMLFTALYRLCSFSLFDFYMLLKKFDATLAENRFDVEPVFTASPKTFSGELIDQFLIEYFSLIDCNNWTQVFDMLSVVQGYSFGGVEEFQKVIATLQLLERKRVLARMEKLMRGDSHFEFERNSEPIDIVSPFLSDAGNDMQNLLGDMHREKRMEQISGYTEKLFADVDMVCLQNYTEEKSQMYVNKGLSGFIYAEHVFYIYSYSELFIKKEVANFAEIFCMKAKALIPNYIEYFTQIYKELMAQCAALTQTDKLLDEKFSSGYRLKVLMDKLKVDSSAKEDLDDEFDKLNEKVRLIISTIQANLNSIYAKFQELLKDRAITLGRHEIISNWDELDGLMKTKTFPALNSICKHMKDFIALVEVLID